MLTWVGSRTEDNSPDHQWTPPKTDLHVGGLVNDEHVSWLEQPFIVNTGDEIVINVIEVETADEPIERKPREDRKHRLARVKHQLSAARALLPDPVTEGAYLASIKGLDEMVEKNDLTMAIDVLGTLGDLNNCPPEFWKELLPAAVDLEMYEQATTYRERSRA